MVSMKYDFPFEVLHMAKLTIKLTCASFVRSSFAERKNRVAGNGLQLKEVGGFSSNVLTESDISPTTNFSTGQKTANFF